MFGFPGWDGAVQAAGGAFEAKLGGVGQGQAGKDQNKKNRQHEHCLDVSITEAQWKKRGGAYSFLAYLGDLTIDHASFSRRSTVRSPITGEHDDQDQMPLV